MARAFVFPGGAAGGSFVPTAYFAFGDSITYGTAASPFSNSFYDLFANHLGVSDLNDYGVGGTVACNNRSANGVFNIAVGANTPSLTLGTIYTYFFGTNDANLYGAGAYEAIYDQCQEASMAWLATPITSKVLGQACSQTGTWTNDTTPASGNGVSSTTNGSTLTCSITTQGKPLYVWYGQVDGGAAVFSYNLDGAGPVSVNAWVTSPPTVGSNEFVLLRITGVSAGAHTVVFTVTSSGGYSVDIWAIGSPPSSSYSNQMRTLVCDVLHQQSDAKASDTAAYATDVANEVSLLQGDGLPLTLAPCRASVNTTTDMFDTLHPNNTGHSHIYNALISVFP